MTVSRPRGKSRFTLCRLCVRAPRTRIQPLPGGVANSLTARGSGERVFNGLDRLESRLWPGGASPQSGVTGRFRGYHLGAIMPHEADFLKARENGADEK